MLARVSSQQLPPPTPRGPTCDVCSSWFRGPPGTHSVEMSLQTAMTSTKLGEDFEDGHNFSNLCLQSFDTAIRSAVFDPGLSRQSSLRPSSTIYTVFHFGSLWSRSFQTAIPSTVLDHSLSRQLSLRQSLMTVFGDSYHFGSLWCTLSKQPSFRQSSITPSLRQSLITVFRDSHYFGSLCAQCFKPAITSAVFAGSKRESGTSSSDMQSRGYLLHL